MAGNKKKKNETDSSVSIKSVVRKTVEMIDDEIKLIQSNKYIVLWVLMAASVIMEIVIILASTKHVAYVINTFDIYNTFSKNRMVWYKSMGTYFAIGFELSLVIVLIGSIVDKQYKKFNFWSGFAIALFLFVNFVGNLYYAIMLFPYLRGIEGYELTDIVADTANIKPINPVILEEVDWLYWTLSVVMMGVLPVMSWVLMNRTYSFYIALKDQKSKNSDKLNELMEERHDAIIREKKTEANRNWRENKKTKNKLPEDNDGKKKTLGDYIEGNEG